jgi:hypothetical protein
MLLQFVAMLFRDLEKASIARANILRVIRDCQPKQRKPKGKLVAFLVAGRVATRPGGPARRARPALIGNS